MELKEDWTRELSVSFAKRYKDLDRTFREGYRYLTGELYKTLERKLRDKSNYDSEDEERLSEGIASLLDLIRVSWDTELGRISCLGELLDSSLPLYPLDELNGKTLYLLRELIAVEAAYENWYSNTLLEA